MIKYAIAVLIGAWLAHGGLLPDPSVYIVLAIDTIQGWIS